MSKKVAIVTGASSGIGRETAIELSRKGFTVYAAARRTEKMQDLQRMGIHPVPLDVTKDESMVSCVSDILAKEGRVDVLINNAGYGSYGALEDVSMEEARHQFDVNVFGLGRMTQLVLPNMRKNKFGKIVNISSVGGRVWTPFGGWYHATKFAVEGYSASLRIEVEQFGIDVIVVEPGGVVTDWGIIAAENLKKASAKGVYAKNAAKTADIMHKNYTGTRLTKPDVIARTIGKAVTVRKPKTRYLIGSFAPMIVFLNRFLGDRRYDRLIKRMA